MCKAPWGPSNLVGRCKSSKLSKLGSYTLWYAQFITKAKTGDHDDVDDNDDDDEDASLGRDDNVKQLPGGFFPASSRFPSGPCTLTGCR